MLSFLGLSSKGDGSPEPTPTPTPTKSPATMGYNRGKPFKEEKSTENTSNIQSTSHDVPLLSLPTQTTSMPESYKVSASMSISDSDSDKDDAVGKDYRVKSKHVVMPSNSTSGASFASTNKPTGLQLRSGALLDEDSVTASIQDQASVDASELDRNMHHLSLQSMTDDKHGNDPTKHSARSYASSTATKNASKAVTRMHASYNEDEEDEEEEDDPNAPPMRIGTAFPNAPTAGVSQHSNEQLNGDEEFPSLKGLTMPDRNKQIDIWRLQTAVDRKEFWVSDLSLCVYLIAFPVEQIKMANSSHSHFAFVA